ncbi:LLM class flavin-dependent oxidoreductase [Roseomonas eburnea]|uniref:LLM class flavin-dependent oxidoreductase n=1 Tax=Neoroseomonas eburnea TaxID=1346889 RepID=A0A9X9X8H5_9PROT|nr:LLM class flavin-dependent oxidoreductase [Neoroseomonas eburnea]MBR0680011.1 LLM class flavin-dependent oxidoreductase [Neoroseomonas eburnea]
MEFALFNLMSLNHAGERPAEVMATTVEAVQLAERTGFDAAWFAEHHFTSASICASPLMMVAHCAAVTRRIRLGPAVVVLPLHHPLRAVQEIGMAQLMAPGRLILGIGTGHQPHEFRSYGIDLGERTTILHEGWDILEQGLATGQVALEGKHYRIPASPICLPSAMPPLYLAGGDAGLIGRAARAGATLLISPGLRWGDAALPAKAKVEAPYRAAGFAGADIPLGVQRYVFVTEDPAEQRRAAEGLLALSRSTLALRLPDPPRQGVLLQAVPFEGEPSVDWLLEHAPIGSAEKVARILADDLRALRPTHVSLYSGFSGLGQGPVLAAVERLGRHVLPALRGAARALAA